MFRIQLLIVRVCEPVELQRLECFCALSDLLTYASEICYFLQALPVQRFPSLASRIETPKGPRRAEVLLSLSSRAQGPLSIQLAASPHPPPLFASKTTPKQEKGLNELFIRDFCEGGFAVATVKLASVGVFSLYFLSSCVTQLCVLEDAAFCRCITH